MTEAWTFIDGMKVSVPLDRCDAVKYGWHHGVEFKQWCMLGGFAQTEIDRENAARDWIAKTFAQNCYKTFRDSIYFYREEDALLCKLRWE